MTADLPCWAIQTLLISPPFLAWFYAINVWIMYSLAHECSWGEHLHAITLRTSLLVIAVGVSTAVLCDSEATGTSRPSSMSYETVLPIGAVLWIAAFILLRRTRLHQVVGFVQRPWYGSMHMKGKTVVITGANSGIGKETARQMAEMGATIYFLCRSEKRAQQAMDEIRAESSFDIERDQLRFVPMDLGDFQSIRKGIDEHMCSTDAKYPIRKIDVLINNAGLMMGTHTKSNDGLELMMQANHFGHFLLTLLLYSYLSNDARILNVTSSTYKLVTDGFDFEDTMCDEGKRSYTLFGQYAQTKLANVLFTQSLLKTEHQPSQPSETCNAWKTFAVHPGLVRTNVTSNMPKSMRVLNDIFAWYVGSMQKTPAEGAYSNVICACAPVDNLPRSGSYIVNGKPQPLTPSGASEADAERLWDLSSKIVSLQGTKKRNS